MSAAGLVEWGGAALLRAWWLAGLPVALAVSWWASRRATAALGDWRRAVDPALLAAMTARGGVVLWEGRTARSALLAACLIALGLAGPALERTRALTYRNLDGVVLVVDASRSVAQGGNLVAARAAARAVAEAAGARQIAVIVFAGDAYLVSPLTADQAELATLLASIDGDTVPDAGSRPARALHLARTVLAGAGIAQGTVVLLSDGGGIDAEVGEAAGALGRAGHALHTVFVPPTATFAGIVPAAARAPLDRLAVAGGGRAASLAELDPILAAMAEPTARRLAASDYAALAWADLGRLLLVAAALPLLLLFRRGAA